MTAIELPPPIQGPQGVKGDTGETGPQGPIGPPGPSGTGLDSGWHYLDAPGEPDYVAAWNFYDGQGKTWGPGRFRRDAAGCVFLELMITGVTNVRTVLFTLPVGFRPNQVVLCAIAAGSSGQSVIEVTPAGVVSVVASGTSANWMNTASLNFMADDAQVIDWVDMAPGLQNEWLPFSPAGVSTPRYFVDNVGDMHFSGQIYGGLSGGTTNFYVLPLDLAPPLQLVFPTCAGPWSQNSMGVAQHARIDIRADGGMNVAGYSGSGTNGFVSLDGMVMSAPKAHWFNPALINGWVAYGGAFHIPSFYVNRNGICAIRGLMKSGTVTVPTDIVAAGGIPIPPNYQQTFIVEANLGFARVDIVPDGKMQVVGFYDGGNNGYVSWNGRFFVPAEGPGVSV